MQRSDVGRRSGVAVLSLALVAGCGSTREAAPAVQPLPRVSWAPAAMAPAPDVDPLLERSNLPSRALQMGDQPLDAWAEAGAIVVYTEHGHVRLIRRADGAVSIDSLPDLPMTCRPTDMATDVTGNVCVKMSCGMGAACASPGDPSWRIARQLLDANGLASAHGAVIAWWDIGEGTTRVDASGHVLRDARPAGEEIVASVDGGRSFGSIATISGRASIRGVMSTSATAGVYVTENHGVLSIHHALPRGDADGHATFLPAQRIDSQLVRLIVANGSVATVAIRGGGAEFTQGFPETTMMGAQQYVAMTVTAMSAWDADTVIGAAGRDLVTVHLSHGRWQRWANWIAMPRVVAGGTHDGGAALPAATATPAGVVALGRVGMSLAVVLADGIVLIYG